MKIPFTSENKGGPGAHQDTYVRDDGFEDQSIRGLTDLYIPAEASESHVRDIADVLAEMGKISEATLSRVHQQQSLQPGSDAERLVVQMGIIDSEDSCLLEAKADLYGLVFRRIEPAQVDLEVFGKLEVEFIKNNQICPVEIEDETLIVATSEPGNVFVIEDVKRRTGMEIRVVVCSAADIEAVCDSFKEEEKIDYCVDDIISDMTDVEVVAEKVEESEDLEQMAGQSPVIKFVNYLISNAINEGASDIHIEPKDKFTKIRYRIDGILFETMQAPSKMHPAVVSRIKIMSNLDISERRLPQDGKISVIVNGRGIDLRVSVLPTSHGEKVVVRVLDSKSILKGLDQLGMEPDVMAAFRDQVKMPHGILLVTGPTGSGKSTTLYSSLCQMDGEKLNISTVEDPVEYQLDFCNQVQANEKIGLGFAEALRCFLRQDPDIIMIGEIRDEETARIAVQAALTGHLVLSTLHTNDAASSITRLVNIGIDDYLIAASLNAVLAQRLVRKICPECRKVYKAPRTMQKYIESTGLVEVELFHGAGCDFCRGSGYVGRVGIYELLIIDDKFKDLINADASVNAMRQAFAKSKAPSLFDDGVCKIKEGVTTLEEVMRVTAVSEIVPEADMQ